MAKGRDGLRRMANSTSHPENILSRHRRSRKLRWTTVVKYASSIAGARQILPLYHLADPINLSARARRTLPTPNVPLALVQRFKKQERRNDDDEDKPPSAQPPKLHTMLAELMLLGFGVYYEEQP